MELAIGHNLAGGLGVESDESVHGADVVNAAMFIDVPVLSASVDMDSGVRQDLVLGGGSVLKARKEHLEVVLQLGDEVVATKDSSRVTLKVELVQDEGHERAR